MGQKEALLEDMIRVEVLAARAREAGYDRDPEVIAQVKRLLGARLWQEQIAAQIEALSVSPAEVQQYYQAHRDAYSTPAQARAAMIFLALPASASDDTQEALAQRAHAVLAEAQAQPASERTFGSLARQYSEDRASKYVGGDMGWVVQGDTQSRWGTVVLEAIFALDQPGTLSPVLATPEGFYLLKLQEKKPSVVRPLAQVEAHIRHQLLTEKKQQHADAVYAALKHKSRITIERALLESLEPSVPAARRGPAQPPALPSG
jgi:parvulin-like peptidyl-prolyl isomerase